MNEEEIKSLIAQLKGVGLTDEEIMDTFFSAFRKGSMEKDDLETLANAMGYDLSAEFKEDKGPAPSEEGAAAAPTESELEDLKSIKPDETKEEFKEKAEDAAEKMPGSDEDDGEDGEDWDKAQKLFRI